jgi:hypothetical protein
MIINIIITCSVVQSLVGAWLFLQFLNPIHNWKASLDGRSARRKAATNTDTKSTYTDIYTSCGIRTLDRSVSRRPSDKSNRQSINLDLCKSSFLIKSQSLSQKYPCMVQISVAQNLYSSLPHYFSVQIFFVVILVLSYCL